MIRRSHCVADGSTAASGPPGLRVSAVRVDSAAGARPTEIPAAAGAPASGGAACDAASAAVDRGALAGAAAAPGEATGGASGGAPSGRTGVAAAASAPPVANRADRAEESARGGSPGRDSFAAERRDGESGIDWRCWAAAGAAAPDARGAVAVSSGKAGRSAVDVDAEGGADGADREIAGAEGRAPDPACSRSTWAVKAMARRPTAMVAMIGTDGRQASHGAKRCAIRLPVAGRRAGAMSGIGGWARAFAAARAARRIAIRTAADGPSSRRSCASRNRRAATSDSPSGADARAASAPARSVPGSVEGGSRVIAVSTPKGWYAILRRHTASGSLWFPCPLR